MDNFTSVDYEENLQDFLTPETPQEPHYDMGRFHGFLIRFLLKSFVYLFVVVICGVLLYHKRRQQTRLIKQAKKSPVVVTSATHTAPGGYPVTQMGPQGGYTVTQMPIQGGYQTTQVYAAPYPTQAGAPGHMQMPMPMPMPQHQQYQQGMPAPYPPMPAAAAANMNPPPYDMAMAGPSAGQQNNASSGFEKQAPYNPSFTAH